MQRAAEEVRASVRARAPVNMPGVYDAMTARLATAAGFDVLFVSGYSVAASRLAAPDYGYLTQTEVAEAARAICEAAGAPVIVDADTGYGNALNAIRTARLFHQAGAAGMFLEDQQWPKRCGHFAGKRVVERDEWLSKLRAVLDLRAAGIDLYLVARTDARAAVSLGEAIDRGKAARDLGVDAVFVEAPEDIAEMEGVAAALGDVTLVANMIEGGRTPLLTPDELSQIGFDLVVTPLTAVFAAARAVREAFTVLKEKGTLRDHLDALVAFAEFEEVVDLDHHRALERRYAPRTGSG